MIAAPSFPRRIMWADPEPELPTEAKLRALIPEIRGMAFEEALAAMVAAVPELAQSRAKIQAVYRQAGFALLRSADLAITEKVQRLIAERIAQGEPPDTQAAIQALQADFTPAYSQLVIRNATTRSYAAGRFEQAKSLPDVAGLEYQATRDSSVRENHLACDGLIARIDDPVWDGHSPPMGHG